MSYAVSNVCHVAATIHATIYTGILHYTDTGEAKHLTHINEVLVWRLVSRVSRLHACATTEYVAIYATGTSLLVRLREAHTYVGVTSHLTEILTSSASFNDIARYACCDISSR